eukprot:TRINITY_DN13617_c0_g1_i1.p1 TRINITY_DN13617_c0_g1~~TRINITY_DN13617_c0_g1_i1.p1  ORF type:complete len:338 (-),score=38.22 TRINITY_DN13617_c0_g1_i1:343-1356(-)
MQVQSITAIVDLILYFALFVFSLVCLIQLFQHSPSCSWSAQKLFNLFAVIACFAKFFLNGAVAITTEVDTSVALNWQFIWLTLPELLVFAAYSFLIVFFTERLVRLSAGSVVTRFSRSLRAVFVVANILFDSIVLISFALIIRTFSLQLEPPFGPMYKLYSTIALGSFAAINVFTVLGFVFYAVRLSRHMKSFPLGSAAAKQTLVGNVKTYVAICAVCFVIRAAFTIVEMLHIINTTTTMYQILLQVFIIIPEWFALVIMVFWMRFRPFSNTNSTNSLLTNDSTDTYDASYRMDDNRDEGVRVGKFTPLNSAIRVGDIYAPLTLNEYGTEAKANAAL